MKKIIALILSLILLLTGCSNTAASKAGNDGIGDNNQAQPDTPFTSDDNAESDSINIGNSNENNPTDSHSVPPSADISDNTPDAGALFETSLSDIPVAATLDEFLGSQYADTTQVILVTVKTEDATAAIVKVLDKTNRAWQTALMTIGYVGAKGSVNGKDRVEGSLKTPLGIYRITEAMGIYSDPGALFPYTQITENMYWDLNSGSSTYNRLVYSDPGGNREELYQMGKQYDYILTTSYNEEQAENKGGAIFIHVSKNEPTAGCISVPRSDMERIIKWADPAKKPVVIICLSNSAPTV